MFDIAIIGAGISGIFLAYTLAQTESQFKILVIEKGKKFSDRICPIEKGISNKCIGCEICDKFQGFGGLGRSEGKFNYTNDFGGDLGEKIGYDQTLQLMEFVDETLCLFGAEKARLYSTENEALSKRIKSSNYQILTAKVRHLGTNLSYEILNKMYVYLQDKVNIQLEADLISLNKIDDVFHLHTSEKNGHEAFKAKNVVLASGLSGGERFLEYCRTFNIIPNRSRVDLGIRVEMKGDQLDAITKDSFETKILYKDDSFSATTYCMNPKGKVIRKYQEGLVMADGQNCFETSHPSTNLNFTVFVPKYFSDGNEAKKYAKAIIQSINQGKQRIVIQRLEDLIKDRFTTKEGLTENTVKPTLNGEGGNLYAEIPRVYIEALFKVFEAIEALIGKEIDRDTLLYGVDAKFYEPEIFTNEYFETAEEGLYVIGDCSGTTYSLSQAAASAVYLGRYLFNKMT